MTNLTISLSDDTIKKLRRAVRNHYGGRKGALSGLIEESVREKLEAFETPLQSQIFRAMKGGRLIAEADDLDGTEQSPGGALRVRVSVADCSVYNSNWRLSNRKI